MIQIRKPRDAKKGKIRNSQGEIEAQKTSKSKETMVTIIPPINETANPALARDNI
jgi:hypothetical protein